MLLIIVTILALAAQILLSLVVLLKDSRSLRNRAFVFLSFALIGWAAVNFLSETFPEVAKNIYVIRSIILFAALQNCFFALFALSLNTPRLTINKKVVAYILLSIIACGLTMSPFIFYELAPTANGGLYPTVMPGMAVFVLHAVISVTIGFRFLLHRLRRTSGVQHQQMLYILFGSVVLWGAVPLTNFVMSLALQTSFFANLSPLYAFVFSAIIAFAIIRHRLFDIRLAIARAVAYLLLLITLISTYAVVVFGSVQLFFGGSNAVGPSLNAVYIAAAVFLAFTFKPLEKFFNRLTNKIFFRDAYETKLVLDKVTSVLVRAVAVDKLTHQSLTILRAALKSEFIAVHIGEHGTPRTILVGATQGDGKPLLNELSRHSHPLLVLDEAREQGGYIVHLMEKANVAVVARLETSKELIGYAFFGYKESGNVYSSQDVGLIKTASDELAVAIQNALRFEEITRFNETLQAQVDEATKQLRESNKKLQALDEAKDEFMSMASHQLRTPLTSVKGYVSMVLEGDAGQLNADQKKLLQEAYASAQRMVYMIADFLNVSRLKTGKFLLEPSTVSLPALINEEISQLAPTAQSRGLTLEAHVPAEFPDLQLDETKIRQVIMNFIDNAIFYSNSGGTIVISLEAKDGVVTFTVKDTGIGVPAAERAKVFSKFFRASNARHVRPDGTGIGLFMAKKVVSAHGGEMIFESQENKGSLFGFTLPYGATAKKSAGTPRPTASR